jgi:hypothetical protein
MVLIETFPNETEECLSEAVHRAFATVHSEAAPSFEFGWLIEWNQRLFREVRVTCDPKDHMVLEELIFLSAAKDKSRATLQLGAYRGVKDAVWVTPPPMGAQIAAQLIDRGIQSTVRPFAYEHVG